MKNRYTPWLLALFGLGSFVLACGGGGGGGSASSGGGQIFSAPPNTISGKVEPNDRYPFEANIVDMEGDISQVSPGGLAVPVLNESIITTGTLLQGSDQLDTFTHDGSLGGKYKLTLAFSGFAASTNVDAVVNFDDTTSQTTLLTLNATNVTKEVSDYSFLAGPAGSSIVIDVSLTNAPIGETVSYSLKIEKIATSAVKSGRSAQKSASQVGTLAFLDEESEEQAPLIGPLPQHTWNELRNLTTAPHAPGMAIIRFKPWLSHTQRIDLLEKANMQIRKVLGSPYLHEREYSNDKGLEARLGIQELEEAADEFSIIHNDTEILKQSDLTLLTQKTFSAINFLSCQPGVEYAELDIIHTGSFTPSDSRFSTQAGHYDQLNLRSAWDLSRGSSNTTVAVLDTGLFGAGISKAENSEFTGRLRDGFDFISIADISLDGDGIDADPEDPGDLEATPLANSSWHGTHVAGTVGANAFDGGGAEPGLGVVGVDHACDLMILRVLGNGGGISSDIEQACRYAAGLSNVSGNLPAGGKAQVINMSLGSNFFLQSFQNAVTAAFNAGVVVVAAAGNDGSSNFGYPASYNNVISVASVNRDNSKSSFSQFNSRVDVSAPGVSVLSTFVADQSGPAGESINFLQGTSMATPHIAGVCSLILSVNPTLTPAQVEAVLQDAAVDLGAAGRDDSFGHGIINTGAALIEAGATPTGPPEIAISPGVIVFEEQQEERSKTLNLLNAGGPTLTVSSAETHMLGGENWITSTTLQPEGTGFTLTLTVSEAGLPSGLYAATVQIESNTNGGQVDVIPVFFFVGNPEPFDHRVFVAVYNDSGVKVGATTTLPKDDFAFTFKGLSAGAYTVGAWGDDNDNGVYENGEETVGAFPSIDDPQQIIVTDEGGDGQVVFGVSQPIQ